MSRSIHATRRTFSKIAKKKFASAEEKAKALDTARRQLARKRRIKRQVDDERGRPSTSFAQTDATTIPVEAHNIGPYVHHSASVKDLRALLALLPPAATAGISSIKLELGREYIDEEYTDEHENRDPFVRRLSYETIPDVYSGVCLGTYSPRSGQIALHAYVYDPIKLPLPQNIVELYLRLRTLTTFVHEVAHHHDVRNRVRRGRWLADRKENVEWYAEKMEHTWTRQFVLRYLEDTYPAGVSELLDFVEHRGGVRLSLEFFAGDSRTTLRNGLIRFAFSTSSAFEDWILELPKDADLATSRLAFAWELHYTDHYNTCLQALERVLSEKPDWNQALTCQADTFIHLERYDEALAISDKVLGREPANNDAWEIRGDVFEAKQDWAALLENCERWLDQVPVDSSSRFRALQHRAVAYCGLGDEKQMETWIDAWINFGERKRKPEFVRKAVFRRAGKALPK